VDWALCLILWRVYNNLALWFTCDFAGIEGNEGIPLISWLFLWLAMSLGFGGDFMDKTSVNRMEKVLELCRCQVFFWWSVWLNVLVCLFNLRVFLLILRDFLSQKTAKKPTSDFSYTLAVSKIFCMFFLFFDYLNSFPSLNSIFSSPYSLTSPVFFQFVPSLHTSQSPIQTLSLSPPHHRMTKTFWWLTITIW
jgi:hypothetical protein